MTISGSGFTGTTAVTFSGTAAASFTVNSDSQITAVTPAHAAGAVNVSVQSGAGLAVDGSAFTYVAPPTITSVSSNQGSTSGGTTVIISGTNLTGATSVTFGGTAASSFTVNSNTQITAVTPAGTAGAVSVAVQTAGGTGTLSGGYTYVAPPTANSQSVTTAYQTARAITLTGSNATAYTVATQPSHGTQSGAPPNLTYTPVAGYSGADSFTFYTSNGAGNSTPATVSITVQRPIPTVFGVSPNQGTTAGGTGITITGFGFTGTTSVTVGGAAATGFSVVSDTQITATTPPGGAGAALVQVTNTAGPSTSNGTFTYVTPPTANSQSVTTAYQTARAVTLSGSNATTYTVATQPSHGTQSGAPPNLTYTPSAGYSGADSFTFYTSNGAGNSAPATVSITVGGPTITLTPAAVPSGRVGVAYNQPLTASGGTGSYTFAIASGALPAGLNLSTTGLLSGTPTAGGGFNFTVTATDANGFTGSQAYSLTINGAIIPVAPPALPNGAVGAPYNQTVSASGGTAPYTFAITAGALPAGLTLSSVGAISGTPTGGGTVNFTVTATDSSTGSGPYTGSRNYTMSFAPPTITVAPATLPSGTVAAPYSQTVTASGGTGSYTFAVTAGALPAGLMLSSAGAISGTPTVGGSFTFTVTATDSSSGSGPYTGSRNYSLNIATPTITVAPATLPNGTVGTAYSRTVSASGGTGSYTFAITAGALPAGITLTSTGTISGTPTAGGSFTFTVTATDSSTGSGPYSGSRSYTVTFAAPTITVAPATLPNAAAGIAYNQPVTASGGTGSYSFAVTAGALPSGIALASNGTISGTSTVAGTFNFIVTATDASTGSGPYSGSRAYSLTVGAPTITVAPPTLPNGTVGTAYSAALSASGGTGSYTYALTAGALPAGLNLSGGGAFSGTPTAGGSFTFTVTATDANGFNGSRSYTLTMAASTVSVAPATLPNGTIGAAYSQTVTASGGTAPYSFAITAGALPAGVTFATNGTISGTPTAGGTFTFTVTATDSSTGTGPYSGSRSYTVTFAAPTITVAPATLPNATAGVAYSQTVTASGGTASYSFAVTAGSLPSGITLASNGTISGTSTVAGSFTFTVTATDSSTGSGPYRGSRAYSLTVGAPTVTVAPATLPNGTVGTAYSQTVTASGGTAPYTYALTAGALPAGLNLSTGGTISGTPTAGGTFTFTVAATDTNSFTGSRSYALTMAASTLFVAPSTLPNGTVGAAYSQTVTASGGTGTYSFAITAGALPAGVTLATNGTISGTPTAGGTATFTVTATDSSTGSGPYSGSRNYTVNFAPGAAGTVLTSSANPSVPGQAVTFTATVTGQSPTGTVTFKDGATAIGTAAVSGGTASFATTALTVGSHAVTAVYGGDGSNLTSTSAVLTQAVNQANSATVLTSSANPSVQGQTVTFTATVTGQSPTGTVTFKDGATAIGTAALSGGTATFTTTALTAGSHAVTAIYGGDSTNGTSTSTVVTQTVTPATAASTTVLAAAPNPARFGEAVTLTATVTAASGAPTGSVTFTGNGTALGTATLSGGVATLTTTTLPVGTDTLVATYSGATGFAASSGTTTATVAAGGSVTVLAATPNPSAFGKLVTLTATVTGQSPTGTVTFKDGGASIGTATLSGGTATLSTAALTAGAHSITAAYAGDAANAASVSPALAQQVNAATTTTRLTASRNPIMAGQSVRFTAFVTVLSNTANRGAQAAADTAGRGALAAATGGPTGSVTFRSNGAVLGTAALAGGAASFVTTALAVGPQSITAVYAGNGSFATSISPALTVQVDPAAGALTLAVTATGRDGSFSFTSTLPGAGAFTLGTVSGKAQRSFTSLPPGTYTLTAGSPPPGFVAQGLTCSSGSTAGSTATVTVAAGATVACTFAANFDAAAIQKATQAAIRTFLQQRAEVISNAEPDHRRMHERLTGSVFGGEDEDRAAGPYGRMPITMNPVSSPGSTSLTATTSLQQMLRPMDKLPFDIWTDVRFGSYRDTPNYGVVGLTPSHYQGKSTVAYTGVDYRAMPGVLLGLLGEYDQVGQASSTLGTSAQGSGYMVGPYTSIALTRNLFFDARAAFGQSANSITPQGLLLDRFDTDRRLYRAELSGRFGWQGLEIDPSIAALYFQERQRAFTDAFGLRIGGQSVGLGQMAVGPDFAYPLALDGALVTPRFGIKAVYDFQRNEAAALALGVGQPTAPLRARMEGGLDIDNVLGFGLGSSISYDGLGDRGYSAIGGRFTAKKTFDVRPEGIFATPH